MINQLINIEIICPDGPEQPAIFGYQKGEPIKAGSIQRLNCVCHGGNPLCQLKWYKNDVEVKEGSTMTVNGNQVTNELMIITRDSDNNAIYKCSAYNSAIDIPLNTSIQLNVYCKLINIFIY